MGKASKDTTEGVDEISVARSNTKAQKALFAAVEEPHGKEENDDTHTICKPLNILFESTKNRRFDSLIPGISLKQQQFMLLETIQNFNKGHARRFFQGLKVLIQSIVEDESYVPESAFQDEGNDDERGDDIVENTDIVPDDRSTEHLHFLKHATMCVEAYLQGQKDRLNKRRASISRSPTLPIVSEVYNVALDLHNILFSLQACGPEGLVTQNAIIKMCESWWHANAIQRDNLIVQCLPLLVLQTLDGKNFQKSHIKRLLNLKEALQIIDFNNPSSDSLRSLLLRVASNPLCLRMPEGRSFLAALFQEPSLIRDLHLAVRAQIPEARGTILKAYGEIYLKAWKDSENTDAGDVDVRDAIEHEAIQDLVHSVIHVSSSATAKSILALLEPFHATKTPEIDGLLYRMYSPIIWRSLGATSAQVRVNAVNALGQVFPLQDASHTQTKAAISKGTLALKSALQDTDPRVRVAGSAATARICGMFWDVLPVTDIRMLLNHIVMEHASDASTAAVRAGALEAITSLLDTSQSRAILRPLLPSLGNLIHDKSEKVRVAAVRMLLAVKQIPGIRFYHVVPVDHLTARFTEEGRLHRSPCNAVAKELTALMLNSYFPQGHNVSGADQLKRTLTFLLTEPSASAVFYANLSAHLTVDSVVKFVVMLLTCLNSAVKVDQARQIKESKAKKKRRRQGSEESREENEDQTLSASNTPLMASLAETICILWESIEPDLTTTNHQGCNERLVNSLSRVDLTNILIHFEDKATESASENDEQIRTRDDCIRTCGAILRCVGKLPPEAVDGVLPHVISSLKSLSTSGLSQRQVSAHIAVLCLWGKTDEVAKALSTSIAADSDIVDSLTSPLLFEDGPAHLRSSSDRKSRNRCSGRGLEAKCDIPSIPPRFAWGLIQDFLQGSDASNEATRKAILSSADACETIEAALERGTVVAEQLLLADSGIGKSIQGPEIEFALRSCEAYGRFALHKAAYDNSRVGFSEQAKLLLKWTTEKVAPSFRAAQSGETQLRDLDLSCILNTSDSLILPGSPSPLQPPRQRANLRSTPNRMYGESVLDGDTVLDEPAVFVVSAIASSLLHISCTIFSEWIRVGGDGADMVAESAVKWCQVFEEDQEEDVPIRAQKELFPAFTRLAVNLGIYANNFVLLKHLLIKCNEAIAGEDTIGKALTLILSVRKVQQRENLVKGIVDTVLEAVYSSCDGQGEDSGTAVEFPTSVDDLWTRKRGSIGIALSVLLLNPHVCVEFVNKLVLHLNDGGEQGEAAEEIMNFQARFLYLLVARAENAAVFGNSIRQLDFGHMESESGRSNIIGKLREIVA